MSLIKRIGNLWRKNRVASEIDEELAAHLSMRVEDNCARGMSREQAMQDARKRFGNPLAIRERTAAMDATLLLENIYTDLRFACRQLLRNPGFAAVAVIVLTLAICANIAIFAFVDATLIQPLPYRDSSRLVALFESTTMGSHFHLSYLDYLDWKRQNKVFTSLEAYDSISLVLATSTGSVPADGATVSDGFFRALGISPTLGRDFTVGEDAPSAPRNVILSYAAWQTRYGGRQDVLGQTVTLDGLNYSIVGVLPKAFHFAPVEDAEFWTTLHMSTAEDRGSHGLSAIARLKDGMPISAAQVEMNAIAAGLAKQYPDADAGRGATVTPLSEIIVGNVRPILLVLLAGAALLLVIACGNVASLLLVRSESRTREVAMRGALGASHMRLIQQFTTESLLLVAVSTVLGTVAATFVIRLLLALIPAGMLSAMPYLHVLGLNKHVLLFAGAISLGTSLLLALVPLMRLRLNKVLTSVAMSGRGNASLLWRKMGANLVVLELTVAMVLLVGAGLLGKSLYRLLHTDTGIRAEHLTTMRIIAPDVDNARDEKLVALTRQIEQRVSQLPGVESVSISHSLPIGNRGGNTTFSIVGRPDNGQQNEVNQRQVSEQYFRTLGGRLLQGRYFRANEDATKPRVAIVNQSMAQRYFSGDNALGKMIRYDISEPLIEIVGVVADIKEGPLDEATRPALYTPFAQGPERSFIVIVRTIGNDVSLPVELNAAIHQIDPGLMTYAAETMDTRIANSQAAYLHRASAWLVGEFAALALILSVVGLYGVVAYSVARRTQEIGVRMALGARREAVLQMVLREAGWLIAAGIGAGVVCAVFAANLMRNLLFGVSSWDVATLASVAALLALPALLASYIPALRAASVNPIEALRAE
jgi:predicted permease